MGIGISDTRRGACTFVEVSTGAYVMWNFVNKLVKHNFLCT